MLAAASPRPGWGSSRRSLNAVGGWNAATAPHQLGKAECVSAFQRVRGVRASVVPFAERRRLAQHQRAGRPSGNARLGATRFAAEQGREGRKLRRDAEKTRRRRPPGSRRGAAGKLLQPRRLLRRRARDGGKPEPVRSPGGLRLLVLAGRAPVRLCRRRGSQLSCTPEGPSPWQSHSVRNAGASWKAPPCTVLRPSRTLSLLRPLASLQRPSAASMES